MTEKNMKVRGCCFARVMTVAGLGVVAFLASGSPEGVSAAPASSSTTQAPSIARSVMNGVFTREQAERGRQEYQKRCVLCHLDYGQGQQSTLFIPGQSFEREGDAVVPPVAGEEFVNTWNGRTVGELFEIISTTMPLGSAGTLSPQMYADVLAYLFELSKFPIGPQELTPSPEQLKQIVIGKE